MNRNLVRMCVRFFFFVDAQPKIIECLFVWPKAAAAAVAHICFKPNAFFVWKCVCVYVHRRMCFRSTWLQEHTAHTHTHIHVDVRVRKHREGGTDHQQQGIMICECIV